MMGLGGQDQQQPVPDAAVPPRVRQAMDFVSMMAQKTMQRAAACENQIELIDGQQLTDEERNAHDSACLCIARYFNGNLPLDKWEQLRYETIRQKVKTGGRDGAILRCIGCGARVTPTPDCELCRGTGRVFVSSFGGNDLMISDEDSGAV